MIGDPYNSNLFQSAPPINQLIADPEDVNATINLINNGKYSNFDLFGRSTTLGESEMDFSQFIPRAHYTSNLISRNYFKVMMWLGRGDLRIAPENSKPSESELNQALRELGTAILLTELLVESGQLELWNQTNDIISLFVGDSDSMNFNQLIGLLKAVDAPHSSEIHSRDQLLEILEAIQDTNLGIQNIISHPYLFPADGKRALPRSFTFSGQRFTVDSWALGKSVFPNVKPSPSMLPRGIPSALDLAFSVFANNGVTPLLLDRMNNQDGVKFRDGIPIQANYTAVRETIDQFLPDVWNRNMYNGWIGALRHLSQLSSSSTVPIPDIFHSDGWNRKIINTQIGSWSQLRHDTVFYVKQSSTPPVLCSFPYQYVEPYPRFCAHLSSLASRTADQIAELPISGFALHLEKNTQSGGKFIRRKDFQQRFVAHYQHFAKQMDTLHSISLKQLTGEPQTQEEMDFLQNIVELKSAGYVGLEYKGWYPNLFYKPFTRIIPEWDTTNHPSIERDYIVTDVHTDFPDAISGDPGGILQKGVGAPQYLFICIEQGGESRIHVGPVFSHFEFMQNLNTRMTDEEWNDLYRNEFQRPSFPDWIQPVQP